MHRSEVAYSHGEVDPVIQESWRRTWWQLYLSDAHYAAIRQEFTFSAYGVDVTTELPCDEGDYNSLVRKMVV
jgi:hypothetical protein